ncbi:S9 family peptidase [bacterium]|nr:S9 family peptidase [bacterium]
MKRSTSQRNTTLLLLIFLITLLPSGLTEAQEKKPVTLRDVFGNPAFFAPRMANLQWMADGEHYAYVKFNRESRSMTIVKVNARTDEEAILLDPANLQFEGSDDAVTFESFSLQKNPRFLVLTLDERPIWRRSTIGTYAVYDLETGALIALPEYEEGVMNVKVSPDGQWVGYVYKDNIYIMNLASGDVRQLTSDAREDVHNGRFGWVYEEEFSIVDGWQWSPDSKRIAFWQEDETMVPTFEMVNFMPLYMERIPIRYPKAGDSNPVEKIGIIDLADGSRRWMDIGEETDQYIPRIRWTKDANTLCMYRLNRLQNHVELLFANVEDGSSRVVLSDRSETGWISVDDGAFLHFMDDGHRFLWASERDGWNHLYLYDYDGSLLRQVTSGEWEIVDVLGVTPDDAQVYFTATKEAPTQQNLYRAAVEDDDMDRLTEDDGWHAINLSPTCALYIDSWSSIEAPTRRMLCDGDGDELRSLGAVDPTVYAEYSWSDKELFTVTTDDGWTLDCSMIKPANFDPSKKYPVFFDVYGGPGTSAVRNSWPSTMAEWYASEGFIVIEVDNRGSSRRGTAFKHAVYKQLGKWEAHDYVQVANYLSTLPFVNADRIGIWGWSYGGYMAALTLLLGNGTFHAGVAIAPPTDWRLYDTIYTERFMQRPQDNPEGYDVGSCLVHADKLQGRLLIIHGGLDDNVHVQNTMQFVHKLEEAGKQFDMRIYPNGNHGVAGGMQSRLGLFEYYVQHMKEHLQDQ